VVSSGQMLYVSFGELLDTLLFGCYTPSVTVVVESEVNLLEWRM